MTTNTISTAEITREFIKNTGIKHIAIIMDGNRRWAKSKHLPSVAGHNEGVNALKRTIQASIDSGLKYLTVYAFSTENWGRKKEEVDFLMLLLKETIKNELAIFHSKGVRIRIIGDMEPLSKELVKVLNESEELTKDNDVLNLQIAINYGARHEIVSAMKKIAQKAKDELLSPENIDEELISSCLYTSGIPDPDLLIRTGGEQRISNYLLWQIAYTELYITEAFWPEFGEGELLKSVQEFSNRQRRFGRD